MVAHCCVQALREGVAGLGNSATADTMRGFFMRFSASFGRNRAVKRAAGLGINFIRRRTPPPSSRPPLDPTGPLTLGISMDLSVRNLHTDQVA